MQHCILNDTMLEAIQREQSVDWKFCVKLMDMLRKNEVGISDTNLDIYKRVKGAMAEDTIQEYKEKANEYHSIMKSLYEDN